MARRNSQQSISLFPFLAVLVCTMGALILLLLVTTRRIRQEQARYTAAVEVLDDLSNGDLADATAVTSDDFVIASTETQTPLTPSSPESLFDQATISASEVDVSEFEIQWPSKPETETKTPDVDTSAEEHEKLQQQIAMKLAEQTGLSQQQQALKDELLRQQEELDSVKQKIQDTEVELLATGQEFSDLDKAESELKTLRSEKDDLEIQISQQKQQLAGVQAELEEQSAFTDQAEAMLTKRESALVSLRRIVAKSSEQLSTDASATLLEFTNTEGTARVPIVINVDGKGFTFQPSGIVLTENDLKGFPANDNPLLAAIQSIAEHRSEALLPDNPYVLLLVRPSGSLAFYQAQQVMNRANIHFGYELLEADHVVDVGQPDAEEVRLVRQAALAALNRRSTLYSALLAAQQQRERHAGSNPARQRFANGNSGNNVQPEATGPRGADGRTLQEIVGFGRVYASGAPKPDPKVPVYRRQPNAGSFDTERWAERWAEPGRQLAGASENQNHNQAQKQAHARPPEISEAIPDSWGNQVVQNTELEHSNPSEPNGNQQLDFPFEDAPERSSNLSNNLGLNGEHSATEMPNASVAQQTNANPLITAEVIENRNSPDADWPIVEPASQPIGSRPVVPELFTDNPEHSVATPADSPSEQFAADQNAADLRAHDQSPQIPPDSSPASQNFVAIDPGQNQFPSAASSATRPPFDNSGLADSSGGPAGSGLPPSDPALSYLQQFLDEVEQQKADKVPNAALLELLNRKDGSGQQSPSDKLASGRANSPASNNAASNNKQSNPPPVFYVVRIYLSNTRLVVGRFQPVEISGWSDQQVAEAALKGVSAAVREVWTNVRKDALPAVRFLVSENAQQLSTVVGQHLQAQNIAIRATQREGRDLSLRQFFSHDLPPTTQQPTGSAVNQPSTVQPNNAQPPGFQPSDTRQQAVGSQGRRISI